ncbi:hypothetical protein J1605_005299 [Eschrichtius robustus]|uniref:Uncharacterized protein n=1 Tax=Eschrichtius robustus TaxID=9764 RepID=A0AB34H8P0_ESCRO|nr:hypothetical protein J1605_005299 [Eschrichtius robustus]
MGSQSSKAPQGNVTAKEAAGTPPTKVNGQENGHKNGRVKSSGDLSPKEEGQEPGESVPAARKALPREGRLPLPESQEPQAKGAEAGAASKGGDTEEAGPQAQSHPLLGPESGPTPAGGQNE